MPVTIGSNIASLQVQRRLGESTQLLGATFERLSSGQRINRASDDAAGLAIISQLQANQRVFSRGIRNLNDGLSALNIADGTVEQLTGIVTRLRELAEQSANGTFSTTQRAALNVEAKDLRDEYFRISRAAQFNGLNLFDGTLGLLRIQAGFGLDGSIASSLGGKLGTGSFTPLTSFTTEALRSSEVISADFNGDGILDMATGGQGNAGAQGQLTISLGNGDGTFRQEQSITVAQTGAVNSLKATDMNGDGIVDLVALSAGGVNPGRVTILLGTGEGDFSPVFSLTETDSGQDAVSIGLGDFNNDGNIDVAVAYSSALDPGTIRIYSGDGQGSLTFADELTTTNILDASSLSVGDLDGDGRADLIINGNNGAVGAAARGVSQVFLNIGSNSFNFNRLSQFESVSVGAGSDTDVSAVADVNGDGVLDLIAAGADQVSILLGIGDGSFNSSLSYALTGSTTRDLALGDVDGDGVLDLVVANQGGTGIEILKGDGQGRFSLHDGFSPHLGTFGVTLADVNGDGVLDILSAGDSGPGEAGVALGNTREGIAPLLDFDLGTLVGARQALGTFERALRRLTEQRGILGAFQSRLSLAVGTLEAARNTAANAESNIADADIARESAQVARLRILQNAGAAVLSQANIQPTLALTLLA